MFEIWDINAASFNAFDALGTQWRVLPAIGFGGAQLIRTGLDYQAVDVVLRRHGLDNEAFADIQVMEAAALSAWAEAGQ